MKNAPFHRHHSSAQSEKLSMLINFMLKAKWALVSICSCRDDLEKKTTQVKWIDNVSCLAKFVQNTRLDEQEKN